MTRFMRDVMKRVKARRARFKESCKEAGVDPLVMYRTLLRKKKSDRHRRGKRPTAKEILS